MQNQWGGGGTNYSTEEQVVGKWIDGKPLYQKVILFGALSPVAETAVNHNVANIDQVCYVDAIVKNGNATFSTGRSTETTTILAYITSTQAILNTSGGSGGVVTFRYTKTTD